MRNALFSVIASSMFVLACGGGGAGGGNVAADTTVRPVGTGWFCHGEENAAFCARSVDECEALRTSQQSGASASAEPTTTEGQVSEGEAQATPPECRTVALAHCFTFQHPTVGTHYRCFDSAVHCENSRGRCTDDETCSVCDAWD